MKTTAIISHSERDYKMHVLQQKQTEPDTNYIHVSSLNEVYGIDTVHEIKSITNVAKLAGLNSIVSELSRKVVPYYDKNYADKQREADQITNDFDNW